MTKTVTINRAALKDKHYKQAKVIHRGTVPAKRDPTLLVQVLKKALAN